MHIFIPGQNILLAYNDHIILGVGVFPLLLLLFCSFVFTDFLCTDFICNSLQNNLWMWRKGEVSTRPTDHPLQGEDTPCNIYTPLLRAGPPPSFLFLDESCLRGSTFLKITERKNKTAVGSGQMAVMIKIRNQLEMLLNILSHSFVCFLINRLFLKTSFVLQEY